MTMTSIQKPTNVVVVLAACAITLTRRRAMDEFTPIFATQRVAWAERFLSPTQIKRLADTFKMYYNLFRAIPTKQAWKFACKELDRFAAIVHSKHFVACRRGCSFCCYQ